MRTSTSTTAIIGTNTASPCSPGFGTNTRIATFQSLTAIGIFPTRITSIEGKLRVASLRLRDFAALWFCVKVRQPMKPRTQVKK